MITEHLSEAEYACHGGGVEKCGLLPPDFDLADMPPCYDYLFDSFEKVRAEWGKAITISSGYRCFKHNKMVGGEELSAHLFGLALDCYMPNAEEIKKFHDCARKACPDLRIGWKQYQGNGTPLVHLDVAFLVSPRPTSNFLEGVEW